MEQTLTNLLVLITAVILTALVTYIVASELSNNNVDEEIKVVLVRLNEVMNSLSGGRTI